MTIWTLEAMILIVCAVFLGAIVSACLAGSWFRDGFPVVSGTRTQLLAIRVLIWSAFTVSCATFIVLATSLEAGITTIAFLFGLQAVLLDVSTRVRYQQSEERVPTTFRQRLVE